ncbi:MAG: T9SS type A sorting domain-containing protein [Ignavibacteriales bacterium]|nr:T9SS type A sorting domain-containing protein [Ignavibacteriales bacterium]
MKKIILAAVMMIFFTATAAGGATATDTVHFLGNELLGRPTANAVTLNLCADRNLDVYVEYGTQPSLYSHQTPVAAYLDSVASNLLIDGLLPNTCYYYRVRYRLSGGSVFVARNEHSFKTAKPKGTAFTFAIEADPHLDNNTNPDLYRQTLSNIEKGNPDFLLDLGDTFMTEKLTNKTQDSILLRHLLLRSFYDQICHSIPLFFVVGNHDGELGFLLDGTPTSLPVMTSNTRLQYFPNPLPDKFYSGNAKPEIFVGLRQNYYAWEWGDALFVVLDPYWYTTARQGDNWRFSLGKDQYDWLKSTLETSAARFKFVFVHQVLGGLDNQGRGGSDVAQCYEMGGLNADSTWGFTDHRPGWAMPIHQLMVKHHVNIFFHGHDHFFDYQQKDGVIYQLVPQPGYPGTSSTSQAAAYGYVTGKILPSSGYLTVAVMDSVARIDYVRSYLPSMETAVKKNGMVDYSYTVKPNNNPTAVGRSNALPVGSALSQNYPNPFNPSTTISFDLLRAGFVRLDVYDVLGRLVAPLLNEYKTTGHHSFSFDASSLPSGSYFYRLSTVDRVEVKKMVLHK